MLSLKIHQMGDHGCLSPFFGYGEQPPIRGQRGVAWSQNAVPHQSPRRTGIRAATPSRPPQRAPLLACHVDLKNAFWSLRLPPQYQDSFTVDIDGTACGFSCLPFGWRFSPAICQTILCFMLDRLSLVSILVLHYLDDFLLVVYGSGNVRSAASQLCSALRLEGAIISPKSVLEPVTEIDWLGKHLVLSGDLAGFLRWRGGWQILVGPWLRTVILPLSRQHACRVVRRFSWALRPQIGACPFLAGWWCHIIWGDSFVWACPLKFVLSLVHCLFVVRWGWTKALILPPPPAVRGLIFVDAAFDVHTYKVGMWGPAFGGKIFKCSSDVRTRQEAELDGIIKGVHFIVNVNWRGFLTRRGQCCVPGASCKYAGVFRPSPPQQAIVQAFFFSPSQPPVPPSLNGSLVI